MTHSGTIIKNHMLLYKSKDDPVFKKNKKKLSKKNILKLYNVKFTKYNENNLIHELINYLKNTRKLHSDNCAILLDSNIIVQDITYIPPVPKEYDILCLESTLKKYTKIDNDDTIYWTPTDIIHSGHFVIKTASINNIIEILKQCNQLSEFFDKVNNSTLKMFTITQNNFSENKEIYVHNPYIIKNNITNNEIKLNDKKIFTDTFIKINNLNLKDQVTQFENLYNDKFEQILPSISLICPVTNTDTFFHCMYSFLKLDYPKHLLEFIIIDDTNSGKKLNLPEDNRIRLLNLSNTQNPGEPVSLGYKLNTGVKYATKNLIMHFFDTNNYNLHLKQTVTNFLVSNQNCMTSNNTGIYNDLEINLPDLANFIYTKDFWKKNAFVETGWYNSQYLHIDLILKWIAYRYNEILFVPFTNISFKLHTKLLDTVLEKTEKSSSFNYKINPLIKVSFDLINNH